MAKKNKEKIDESLIYQLSTDMTEKNRLARVVFSGAFISGLIYFVFSNGTSPGFIALCISAMIVAYILRAAKSFAQGLLFVAMFVAPIVALLIYGPVLTVFFFLFLSFSLGHLYERPSGSNAMNSIGRFLPLVQIFFLEAFGVVGIVISFIIFHIFFLEFFS